MTTSDSGRKSRGTLRRLTRPRILILLLILAAAGLVFLGRRLNATKRGGQAPAEPFRIAGNFYYVGANDAAAFLLTGPRATLCSTVAIPLPRR